MSKNDTLNARQKGDIYWRKLKRLIEAEEERGIERNEADNIAGDVFLRINRKGFKETVPDRLGCGNEFNPIPPTAASGEIYADNICLAVQCLYYFESFESHTGDKEYDTILNNKVHALAKVISDAVSCFFASMGIDETTGKSISNEKRDEARGLCESVFSEYENAIKHFKTDAAVAYMNKLIDKSKIKKAGFENEIDAIIVGKDLNDDTKKEIDKVSKEYVALKTKESEMASLMDAAGDDSVKGAGFELLNVKVSFSEAYEEYRKYISEQIRAVSFAADCCKTYVNCLVNDDIADPRYAAYIMEHWKKEVKTLSFEDSIYALEGYDLLGPKLKENDLKVPSTADEFNKIGKELKEYMESHPKRFFDQTVSQLLFDMDGLPDVIKKAEMLKEGILDHLSKDDPDDELIDMWAMADAISDICSFVLDYSLARELCNVRDLLNEYEEFIFELDYRKRVLISKDKLLTVLERRADNVRK